MTIRDGVYRLKNVKSGTYFDNSSRNRDVIHGWDSRPGSGNQEWTIQQRGDGYTIKNVASGRYATASNPKNGTDVKARDDPCEWHIRDAGDGAYSIFLHGSDAVIDLDMGKDENGTAINVWDSTGARQQKWRFEHVRDAEGGGYGGGREGPSYGAQPSYGGGHESRGEAPPYRGPIQPGRYAIQNAQTNHVADLAGGSRNDGCSILGYEAGGADNQKWEFSYGRNGYIIKNAQSGTYLSYTGGANEGTLITGQSQPQEWEVVQSGDSYSLKANGTNLILDLAVSNENKLCLWSDNGAQNQRWKLHQC